MTYKQILIILLSFAMSGLQSFAQTLDWGVYGDQPMTHSPEIQLGVSKMECVYEHYVYDPYKKKSKVNDRILEVGQEVSVYRVYGTYQLDSVVARQTGKMTVREHFELAKKYSGREIETVKYLDKGKLTHRQMIFPDKYIYEEPIPTIEWRFLSDAAEEVCGYQCKKAVAEFRGRTWTAWYAEAIQIDNGPWKFGGLPGLILKVEDSKKEHIFEAIQIRNSHNNMHINASSSEFKTDRKSFNRMMREFCLDAGSFLAGNPLAPTTVDGKSAVKKRRMLYNPIELD